MNRSFRLLLSLSALSFGCATAGSGGIAADTTRSAEAPLSSEAAIDHCVRFREEMAQCKAPFIDQMVSLRGRLNPTFGKELADPAKRREFIEIGLKEIAEDGEGPRAPRAAKCAEAIKEMPLPTQGVADALTACGAMADCEARVACAMPLVEKLMASR